jgi:hypothetical protein
LRQFQLSELPHEITGFGPGQAALGGDARQNHPNHANVGAGQGARVLNTDL